MLSSIDCYLSISPEELEGFLLHVMKMNGVLLPWQHNEDFLCVVPVHASKHGNAELSEFSYAVVMRELQNRVIIDCPPVSAVSDPLVIASICDGTVFVTKFNKIRRDHARRSVQRIQDAGVKIIGAVVNDIDFEGKDSYYYSYYYYRRFR